MGEHGDVSARVLFDRRVPLFDGSSVVDGIECEKIIVLLDELRELLVPSRAAFSTGPPLREEGTLFAGEMKLAHVDFDDLVGFDPPVSIAV